MAHPTVCPGVSVSDDLPLLERLRDGDESAFESVFRTWYAPLVRFATRLVGDSARAEEIVQDTMLALWRSRERLSAHTSAQAWLFHATRNRALNQVRHDGIASRAALRLVVALAAAARDSGSDADRALLDAELHAAIDKAVTALPPRCREVFMLSRTGGMRQIQIAQRLGISIKSVEAHITKARRDLRIALAPWLERDTHR